MIDFDKLPPPSCLPLQYTYIQCTFFPFPPFSVAVIQRLPKGHQSFIPLRPLLLLFMSLLLCLFLDTIGLVSLSLSLSCLSDPPPPSVLSPHRSRCRSSRFPIKVAVEILLLYFCTLSLSLLSLLLVRRDPPLYNKINNINKINKNKSACCA